MKLTKIFRSTPKGQKLASLKQFVLFNGVNRKISLRQFHKAEL